MQLERRMAVLAAVLMATVAVGPVHAAGASEDDGHAPIVIVGTVLANLGYFPAKLVYSILGGVTGVMAYVVTLGDTDSAQAIWDPACRGTYIINPAMMEGKEPVHFSGP